MNSIFLKAKLLILLSMSVVACTQTHSEEAKAIEANTRWMCFSASIMVLNRQFQEIQKNAFYRDFLRNVRGVDVPEPVIVSSIFHDHLTVFFAGMDPEFAKDETPEQTKKRQTKLMLDFQALMHEQFPNYFSDCSKDLKPLATKCAAFDQNQAQAKQQVDDCLQSHGLKMQEQVLAFNAALQKKSGQQ